MPSAALPDGHSRYVWVGVREELRERSRGLCECCGFAGDSDRHHLIEFHLGGPNTVENLLVLCPSCHTQVAKYLSIEQQRLLQEWHHSSTQSGTLSATARLQSSEFAIDIGTVIFRDVRNVMATGDQNVITLHREESGVCCNIVMLAEEFSRKLLVLSNKLIVGDDHILQVGRDRIDVQIDGDNWFTITAGDPMRLRGQLSYRGEPVVFTDDGYRFRGANLKHVVMECANNERVAIRIDDETTDYNFGGATVRVGPTGG